MNVLAPEIECDPFLGGIARSIVDAGHARLVRIWPALFEINHKEARNQTS
jgi:hypothetical protein